MHLLSVFSLRNRALIALLTIVVGIFGGIALTTLKQELIPSVSFPQLVVVTAYPGASPDVVETDVSTPIETAIQGVAGLESTVATSTSGASTVSASFVYGTDIATAEQKVQLAINRLGQQLPAAVDPLVITGSIEDLPVIQIAVTSGLDPDELSARLESSTITDLQQIDGVREASLLGTSGKRVTITPDAAALTENGLTSQAIRDALDANGVLLAAGQITEDDSTLTVQAGQRLGSAEDIAALPVLGGSGDPVIDPEAGTVSLPTLTIDDIADVAVIDNPVTGISRVNGEPALTIAVTKTPAGNTVDVSEAVQDALPGLEEAVGDGTTFTVVFDQAPFIQQSIEALATEGLLGLGFAVIVIFVFLLSIRSTIVTAISIPVSVLLTFIGMLATGYTLNILTLGALTIAIGRVVDDSIVVIENIKRHLGLGKSKLEAIQTGVREVATAVTASTVTTVAVFLPLALVGDITGELFRPFALTVTIALAASLFVSLTIVPVLAYWFLKSPSEAQIAEQQAAQRDGVDELDTPSRLQKTYLPVIRWTLRFPAIVLVLALLVLVGSGFLATTLKTNFIGDSGQNTITVSQALPAGTSLEAQDTAATTVEDRLRAVDGVEIVQLSIGSSGSSLRAAFGGGGDTTYSITTDPDADQEVLQSDIREAIDGLDADEVGEVTVQSGGSAFASSDIEVNIQAPDAETLDQAADEVLTAVRDLSVTEQAESNLAVVQPYIAIQVDRQAAAAAGLSEIAVGGIVTNAMLPAAVGSVVVDAKTLQIYITDSTAPVTIQQLRDFQIPTVNGPVALSTLADVEQVDGPSTITTIRGVRSATVTITPNGDDVGTASASVQTAVDGLDLPDGATAELGGVTADQNTAFQQLGLALLAAILIVYTVMVAAFRSLRQPLLLLISVPFAATGAVLLQLATGVPLGVPSLIGLLMLIGIVVTNAIVLIDLVNQYRERGMKVADAVVHGASRRLRPILMTALATIFALVPMALGITGHGGFISQPLAIIVIGGLISSTLLTLVVLPSLYSVVEGAGERRADRRAVLAGGDPRAVGEPDGARVSRVRGEKPARAEKTPKHEKPAKPEKAPRMSTEDKRALKRRQAEEAALAAGRPSAVPADEASTPSSPPSLPTGAAFVAPSLPTPPAASTPSAPVPASQASTAAAPPLPEPPVAPAGTPSASSSAGTATADSLSSAPAPTAAPTMLPAPAAAPAPTSAPAPASAPTPSPTPGPAPVAPERVPWPAPVSPPPPAAPPSSPPPSQPPATPAPLTYPPGTFAPPTPARPAPAPASPAAPAQPTAAPASPFAPAPASPFAPAQPAPAPASPQPPVAPPQPPVAPPQQTPPPQTPPPAAAWPNPYTPSAAPATAPAGPATPLTPPPAAVPPAPTGAGPLTPPPPFPRQPAQPPQQTGMTEQGEPQPPVPPQPPAPPTPPAPPLIPPA